MALATSTRRLLQQEERERCEGYMEAHCFSPDIYMTLSKIRPFFFFFKWSNWRQKGECGHNNLHRRDNHSFNGWTKCSWVHFQKKGSGNYTWIKKFRSAMMKKLRLIHNSYSRDYVCYLTRNPQLISSKNISSMSFVVSHLHFLILLDYRERQKISFSKRNMGTDFFCTIRSTVFRFTVSLRWWSTTSSPSMGKSLKGHTFDEICVQYCRYVTSRNRKSKHCLWWVWKWSLHWRLIDAEQGVLLVLIKLAGVFGKNKSAEQVIEAGEKALVCLYNGNDGENINHLRLRR